MRFSKSIETQLTAAANAADRANRPRMLVVVPAILLIGGLVLTLVIFQRFSVAKSVLSSRLLERGRVQEIIDYSKKLEDAHPDPAKLFPVNDFMELNILDVAKEFWPEGGPVTVGQKSKPRSLGLNRLVERSDIDVSIVPSASIDDLFRFIHEVLTKEELKGVFLSKVDLRPSQGGWVGSLRFSLYERAR
jgi:hypothetical protein